MIRLARILARARSEDGGILLMFALMLPGLLLLAALALEIGNWYEHRRHLQLQTDAGTLAAGQLFRLCASDPGSDVLTPMTQLAAQYGGDKTTLGAYGLSGLVNQQVGQNGPAAGDLPAFSYQGTAYPPDYTPAAETDPCQSRIFDVRATERDIPHVFGISPLATVHAHSQVKLEPITKMKGLLPLAVPDVRPRYVFASFVNEDTGATIGSEFELCPTSGCYDPTNPPPNTGASTLTWVPKNGPVSVTIPAAPVGVRLRLVGGTDPATTCGTLYTLCYDAGSPNGVVFVRGWDGAAAAPKALDAWLTPGSCSPDAYFASADCDAGLAVDVDLGTNAVDANTHVWATVDGNGRYDLAPERTGTGVIRWSVSGGIPLSGDGPHEVDLEWKQGNGNNGNSLGMVQRGYVASPDSGPLQLVQVYEQGVNTSGANSFEGGSTHTLGVTINTIGNLLLSQPTDPAIYLRLFNDSGSASQNQSLNCDRDLSNLQDELQFGCSPFFVKNPALTCPGGNANNLWDIWYVNKQALPCVVIETGAAVGQISHGLNLRIYGEQNPSASDCASHPINWLKAPDVNPGTGKSGFDQNAHADDPRALPLIVTPLGTFTGRGGDQVPVIDFGYFYVTGYRGDPCAGTPYEDPVPSNRGAYVRGHFVKFFPLEGVVPDENELCDLNSIAPCIPVLTR